MFAQLALGALVWPLSSANSPCSLGHTAGNSNSRAPMSPAPTRHSYPPGFVVWFAALVLVIQQIDGNIVGPKILGEKVGVDSLLIIVAITLGGGLFGIFGMFVGVPVFTIIYHVFNEFVTARLKKKGLSTEASAYSKKGAEK